jgi:hypothetical protein
MKSLVIKEEQKIVIPKVKLEINYKNDSVKLIINDNTNFMVNGDFIIGCNGELSLVSNNGIHLDSIDSNIHLNSRKSKFFNNNDVLKLLKEECKEQMQEENLQEEIKKLKQRISDLEIKMSLM